MLVEWKEYEYDTLDRLTKAKTKDPITEQVTDTLEFQIDDIGNLTYELDDDTTDSTYLYATNNMNELIKVKEDESARNNPDVDVWGTVRVDSGATITLIKVNELNADYSAGYFSKNDLSLTNDATQTVTAVVTDSRGYVTTHTVTLYYDEMADIGYAYDLRGNMIYKSEHGEETLYIYDDRDFLREAHLPNGDMVIMETGPTGRRLKREFYDYSEGTWETAYYVYAGIQGIADYDEDWNLEAYYIPGLGIDRIEIMRKNNTDYYFVRDHLGSVRLALDSNCDILEQYEYSTYGELTIKNGSGQNISSSAIGNRHTYTGREWDENLELYYYRARWYDPKMRHFTQKDIIHFTNRYIYVMNNPLNFRDPFGLYGEKIDGYGTFYPPMYPGDTGWWDFGETEPIIHRLMSSKLTVEQYNALKKLRELEKQKGTYTAASLSSNTYPWGPSSHAISPFNTDNCPTGTKKNIQTKYGELDIDWLTDLNMVPPYPYTGPLAPIIIYPLAKYIHTGIGRFFGDWHGLPYQDPGERTAVLLRVLGKSYSDILDDEFFEVNDPNKR